MARELPIFTPPGTSVHHGSAVPDTIAMGGSVTPLRRHPDWIKARMPSGEQLPRPQGPAPRARPQHRLRGGQLPEHRGVLGPAHRHDHDPGRHLHPGLRLLRGQDRAADLVRRRRAAPGGRGAPRARPRARGRHQCRPRRPARRRCERLRRDHPPDACQLARHGHRGAHPGLQRRRGLAADRDGRPPGHPQPQPRDRPAAPEAGPQARPLGSQPRCAPAGQGDGQRDRLPGPHQELPDGRARRGA